MNEPTLTDADRGTLSGMLPGFGYEWTEMAEEDVFAVLERIVAARVAEAVDRERAAWATKIEATLKAERDGYLDSPNLDRSWIAGWHSATDHLRARLLAADDTEAKP